MCLCLSFGRGSHDVGERMSLSQRLDLGLVEKIHVIVCVEQFHTNPEITHLYSLSLSHSLMILTHFCSPDNLTCVPSMSSDPKANASPMAQSASRLASISRRLAKILFRPIYKRERFYLNLSKSRFSVE